MVRIVTRAELAAEPAWGNAFAHERKDARYYELVDETLADHGFDYRYLVIAERFVQPFFVLDQDVTEGAGKFVRSTMRAIRKVFPRFLKMRTLMVGCAAGEGHLDARGEGDGSRIGETLARALPRIARDARAGLIVMKEFPSRYRAALSSMREQGFTRVPSLPMTKLSIDYASFDDYLSKKLSKVMRKNIRRKLRAAEDAQLSLQVVRDVTPYVDELHPLYLAVYERSELHFEKLTKAFLCELGRRMSDKARFFIWRQGTKAVAFSICLVNDDTLYDEYLGLDYDVALELHLYHYTLRDIINWSIEHGMKWYVSSALNYDPKLHLRCELVPLDLYVRHTSSPINAVMRRVLPWLEPTRNDPILKRFPNFSEVWGDDR